MLVNDSLYHSTALINASAEWSEWKKPESDMHIYELTVSVAELEVTDPKKEQRWVKKWSEREEWV